MKNNTDPSSLIFIVLFSAWNFVCKLRIKFRFNLREVYSCFLKHITTQSHMLLSPSFFSCRLVAFHFAIYIFYSTTNFILEGFKPLSIFIKH